MQSDTPSLARRWGPGRAKAILVLVAAVTFALSPLFTSGFNGFDPQAFPVPQDSPPVQPAGYAFSIWGLIYAWLILHAGYGLFARASDPGWDAGRWPLFLSLGLGTGWIALANASPVMATIVIWLMLIGALTALMLAPRKERLLAQAPLALYAGWLTAASWVSVGLLLAGYGVMSPWAAALTTLPLATLFALAVQIRLHRAPEYAGTVIWALIAVIVANAGAFWSVAVIAGAGALALAGAGLWAARR